MGSADALAFSETTVFNAGRGVYESIIQIQWNGTDEVVTLKATEESVNGCTSSELTLDVTKHALPIGTLTSSDADNVICAGDNVIFTATGGVNYNFKVDANSVQNGPSATYATTALTSGQIVTVEVTNGSGCFVTYAGISTTVNALPVPNLSGMATVCEGATGIIYTTEAGMSNYGWNVSEGGTITSGGGVNDNTATVTWNTAGPQSVDVNYENANGCTGNSATVYNVTVIDAADKTLTINGGPVCEFEDGVLTIVNSEMNVTYKALIGATQVGLGIGNGVDLDILISSASLSLGPNNITITAEKNGCLHTMDNSATIVVNALPKTNDIEHN